MARPYTQGTLWPATKADCPTAFRNNTSKDQGYEAFRTRSMDAWFEPSQQHFSVSRSGIRHTTSRYSLLAYNASNSLWLSLPSRPCNSDIEPSESSASSDSWCCIFNGVCPRVCLRGNLGQAPTPRVMLRKWGPRVRHLLCLLHLVLTNRRSILRQREIWYGPFAGFE